MDMMGEAIEKRVGEPFRAEDRGPFIEWQVADDERGAAFVALAEHLEEQLGADSRERHITQFVDDNDIDDGVIDLNDVEWGFGPIFANDEFGGRCVRSFSRRYDKSGVQAINSPFQGSPDGSWEPCRITVSVNAQQQFFQGRAFSEQIERPNIVIDHLLDLLVDQGRADRSSILFWQQRRDSAIDFI